MFSVVWATFVIEMSLSRRESRRGWKILAVGST